MQVPTYDDVSDAAVRLHGHAIHTPLLRSEAIDAIAGTQVWLKPECVQHVHAFKYRGARNRLSAMSAQERACGVVAFSSGNHAQGVARAAKELGIEATIVMPSDAPEVKIAGVRADGAHIVSYDRSTESREEIAAEIARREGRVVVPSFDDPFIIAGQGTVGYELASAGVPFDAVITCIGGGGLCAGISLALAEHLPSCELHGVEPEHYNDHQMSLAEKRRVSLSRPPATLCDAIMTPQPGELTWAINGDALKAVHTVTDAQALKAMRAAYDHLGVVLEPGGAVALAATLTGALADYERVCVILSGGNADPAVLDMAGISLAA